MKALSLSIPRLLGLLREEYGDPHWWPGDSEFEIVAGAILTQRTSWDNVAKAVAVLKERRLMSPGAIIRSPRRALEEAVRPTGFYRQKAEYLVCVSRFIRDKHEGSIERMKRTDSRRLREDLLEVRGIGPETADSILLYALGIPSFVVDAYTIRLLARLGVGVDGHGYDAVKRAFEVALKGDLESLSDMHALIVIHCKSVCRSVPECRMCCLRSACPSKLE